MSTTVLGSNSSDIDMPKFIDQSLSVHQKASMALMLASFFLEDKGVPLVDAQGKPSEHVQAAAAALLS